MKINPLRTVGGWIIVYKTKLCTKLLQSGSYVLH